MNEKAFYKGYAKANDMMQEFADELRTGSGDDPTQGFLMGFFARLVRTMIMLGAPETTLHESINTIARQVRERR